jgi:TatD DNase family protein
LEFQVLDSVGFEQEDMQSITRTVTQDIVQESYEAFDSHFHLDRLSKSLFGHRGATVAELLGADVGRRPEVLVDVVGGVIVFCDPESYPKRLPRQPGFGVAIGVHPRKARSFEDKHLDEFSSLLRSPGVIALGEIGLDHTEPQDTWAAQEELLVKLLQYSMPIRPVVVHLRDQADRHAGEVGAKCLQLFKANAAPTQRIHLHCFGGTVEQIVGWLEAFPQCHFGFTNLVNQFDKYQVAALRRVPANRLLLETDAPYFKPFPTARASTPAYIGETARAVSQIRGETLEEVLRLTAENGRRLYGL